MTNTVLQKIDHYTPLAIAISYASIAVIFMGPAGAGWAATVIAAWLAMPSPNRNIHFGDIGHAYIPTLIIQYLHIWEELQTGFGTEFPAKMGFTSWSESAYMAMTGGNLFIVTFGMFAIIAGTRTGTFVAGYLALIAFVNGAAHPILAIVFADNWYFPGLFTAIPQLGLGIWLWLTLASPPRPAHMVAPRSIGQR